MVMAVPEREAGGVETAAQLLDLLLGFLQALTGSGGLDDQQAAFTTTRRSPAPKIP